MKKWYALSLVVVALFGFGYIHSNRGLNKPDEILVRELFRRGEEAVETKDLKKAMSCVSADYKGTLGTNRDGLKLLTRQVFHQETRYDVQIDAPDIEIRGSDAVASTKVAVNTASGAQRSQLFSAQMSFILKKEPIRRYYIYPVKEWKIVNFEGLNMLPDGTGMDGL